MMTIEDKDCTVTALSVTKSYDNDQGKPLTKVRFVLEMQLGDEELGKLPYARSAVERLVSESKEIQDGPNTYTLHIRQAFSHCCYELRHGKTRVALAGEVVLRPKVAVVMGKVAIAVTIESSIPPADEAKLANMVLREGVKVTIAQTQVELFSQDGDELEPLAANG